MTYFLFLGFVPNNQVMPDRRVELSRSKKIVASFGRPRIDRKGRIMATQDKQRVKPIDWSDSSFETSKIFCNYYPFISEAAAIDV